MYFNHQTDISHGQSIHQVRQVPAGEPGFLTQHSDMWCYLWRPRGQIVMTPSGKGTNTINSVKGDLCSFWPLWFGLFINLFSFPPSEWKADKVHPGQTTPTDLLLAQVILGERQPISLSGGIWSFLWGAAYERSWSKTTSRAPVLSPHPLKEDKEMAFATWKDYFSAGEREKAGSCAAVTRCVTHLWYSIDLTQTTEGMDEAALGQALLHIREIP